SLVLLFGQFWVPFFFLLPRGVKRSYLGLGIGVAIELVAHYVDIYWLVMPNYHVEFAPSWMDLAGLALPLGLLVAYLGVRAQKDAVYPLKDPRLSEAVALVNL